ncbi:MAG: hypothetical protein MI685_10325 [Chlorobiales bacterium]|nr:hypothetical protein [Chlorobiales bacterium]
MAENNELFEMLVKVVGEGSHADKTLADLKKEAKDLDKQLQGMKLGSKQFDEVRMKATNLKTAIKALERPTDNVVKGSRKQTAVMIELTRVLQDARYGTQGFGNNIERVGELWPSFVKEAGGAKQAVKALVASLAGPAGITLGISVVTMLAALFGNDLLNAIFDVNDELSVTLARLQRIGSTNFKSVAEVNAALGELQGGYEAQRRQNILAKIDKGIENLQNQSSTARGSLGEAEALSGFEEGSFVDINKAEKTERELREVQAILNSMDFSGAVEIAELQTSLLEEKGVLSEEEVKVLEGQVQTYNKLVKTKERLAKEQEQEEKRLTREGQEAVRKYRAAAKKREREMVAAQESLYSSMISNVEAMITKDLGDLEMAKNMLLSGPLVERYAMLLRKIERTVPQIADRLIQQELNTIYQKLVGGKQLTSANLKFLELQGVLNKQEVGFVAQYSAATVKAKEGDNEDLLLSARWEKDWEELGDDFQHVASEAFEYAVSLFSAQLAAAIVQGGASFAEVLGNVATTFGQMLLQFIIEAFAKKAAMSILGVIGLAEGSPAAPPGYTWVGEKGPELVRFQGGEEVVPNNQVGRRLDALYNAGLSAQDFGRSGDISSIINALDRQTRAMLKDRLNYEITDRGSRQIARATKKREGQIKRYTGG